MIETGLQHAFWKDTVQPRPRRWPSLAGTLDTDVAIIGAGITGLSAAWHLLNAGQRVVILEAGEAGGGTTGQSTGNLYVPVGSGLHAIEKKHGDDALLTVVSARSAALDFIEERVNERHIACDFQRVPFHLFAAPDDKAAEAVRKEFDTARRIGVLASNALPDTFPFRASALTTVADQAQFNPLQYAAGLAAALKDRGCRIFEDSRVLNSEDGEPCTLSTAAGRVTATEVVKATHIPQGLYGVHAAMLPQREHAVLARINDEPPPPGIYWNANPAWPYSVRPLRLAEGNYVMVLGEPHKPGEQSAEQLERMGDFLRTHFAVASIEYTWAAQNYQPADLLPYIGTSSRENHTWIATGFAADGLVWGTFAGKLISDGILGIENRWAATFDPKRFTPMASARIFLQESAAVSKYLLHDFLVYGRVKECDELAPGDGCIVNVEGEKIAACRDRDGQLHVVSAVCTHLGCLVHWNALELSWDCPCHGSRFSMEGQVLEGPALSNLAHAPAIKPQ